MSKAQTYTPKTNMYDHEYNRLLIATTLPLGSLCWSMCLLPNSNNSHRLCNIVQMLPRIICHFPYGCSYELNKSFEVDVFLYQYKIPTTFNVTNWLSEHTFFCIFPSIMFFPKTSPQSSTPHTSSSLQDGELKARYHGCVTARPPNAKDKRQKWWRSP